MILSATFNTSNERFGIFIIISFSFKFCFCNFLARGSIASGDFIPFCILETFFALSSYNFFFNEITMMTRKNKNIFFFSLRLVPIINFVISFDSKVISLIFIDMIISSYVDSTSSFSVTTKR